jgi:hypothetical protein
MGQFGTKRTRFCMGDPDPTSMDADTRCQHDGHGWWESDTDWGDWNEPGLWFKDTCQTCGRHSFSNTKGERRFP